jgi:hypothetical protein
MMYETIGIRSTFSLYANYAYRLLLGSGSLAMGLKAGFVSGNQEIDDQLSTDPAYGEKASDYFLPTSRYRSVLHYTAGLRGDLRAVNDGL